MNFRIARHTNNLAPIVRFYKDILGLTILGEFNNHDGYSGVFLGLKKADWHLEFTVSDETPAHQPDEDDLLVFYLTSTTEFEGLRKLFKENAIAEVEAKNPYWKANGVTYIDPDGYRIVLSVLKCGTS